MSILRPFKASDMFKFNNINLDIWTETYGIGFYLSYLSRWPDLCCVQEAPSGRMMGYGASSISIRCLHMTVSHHFRKPPVIGKAEGSGAEWHGHVTALTVAPEYRRLSLARKMMGLLEMVSDEIYKGFFVDLYVRCANHVAIDMYEGLGYSVYRRVREYYGSMGIGKGGRDEEDAFDMRKPLSRDPNRRSVRANGRDMVVSAHDVS
ncbi:N-terminal acetyltransferase B complex catalytic subunit naa20 [Hypsizygus marmoreus]|uniref:N-terminal acetyltransferase B complex catalytic subunit naa20 n=1 Tax=Hypsizygus marmoreus TaxID=39966 RepID=A0A369JNV3_HYPMA|nr:N-terminal acetyltransferase B complex catalytic subunit naa20 [Hypsizygus marmoreus]